MFIIMWHTEIVNTIHTHMYTCTYTYIPYMCRRIIAVYTYSPCPRQIIVFTGALGSFCPIKYLSLLWIMYIDVTHNEKTSRIMRLPLSFSNGFFRAIGLNVFIAKRKQLGKRADPSMNPACTWKMVERLYISSSRRIT